MEKRDFSGERGVEVMVKEILVGREGLNLWRKRF